MAKVAHATIITCTRTLSPENSKEKDFARNPLREVSGSSRSRLATRFARKVNTVVPLLVGVSLWLVMPDQVVTVVKAQRTDFQMSYTHRNGALSVACNLMP